MSDDLRTAIKLKCVDICVFFVLVLIILLGVTVKTRQLKKVPLLCTCIITLWLLADTHVQLPESVLERKQWHRNISKSTYINYHSY